MLFIPDHILFAFFTFVLPILMIWRQSPEQVSIPDDTRIKVRLYWGNSMVLWIAAILILADWLYFDRSLSSLGFRMPDLASMPHVGIVLALFLLLYYLDTAFSWHADLSSPAANLLPSNWKEFAHFGSVVSLSAAFCEEIVFRGFMISYMLIFLEDVPYGEYIAILVSSIVFGIVHAYQGWTSLLKIIFLSALFGLIFILSNSLWVVIALHFLVDFCSAFLTVVRKKELKMQRLIV